MRHDFLDRYSRINSIVHRLPTSSKIITSIVFIIIIVLHGNEHFIFFIITFILLLFVNVMSRIPLSFIGRRFLLFEPFIIVISLMILFQPDGFQTFLFIITKSTLCLYVMILLSNTTRFTDILNFLKKIHIPSLIITLLALMYRYIFVLIDESEKMSRARKSRTFTNSKAHLRKNVIIHISQLFVRTTERAERIYASMRARGWR